MIENTAGVSWALGALSVNGDAYSLAADYYDGRQRLAFATDKFRNAFGLLFREFSINHCAVCVDVPADRLQVDGFAIVGQEEAESGNTDARIQEIWRRNRMNKRAGEVHVEAFKAGDAYVIVDWIGNRATIYPNAAGRCAVLYDEENPGVIKQAARWWVVPSETGRGFRVRLNIYYPDRIEKYQTRERKNQALASRANEYEPIAGDWNVPNPFDKVPVFHFANNADIGCLGRSELANVIPAQDGLNKAICDAMVGAEYAVMGQRYVTGFEIEEDENGNVKAPFKDGLANLWVAPPQMGADGRPLPASEAQPITFGQFTAANLEQLLALAARHREHISLISGIPSHYFMQATGGWPSGESLKTAEQRLTSKVMDRQIAFGNVWADVVRFCLQVEGVGDVDVETVWRETGPQDTKADVENAAVKREKLGYPLEKVWAELGEKPGEIEQMKEMKEEEALGQIRQESTVIVPTVNR